MDFSVFIAIVFYMLVLLAIGYYSYKKTTNINDYMLGGRDLGPAVTALSAGASDMSGWMLMGLPGAVFAMGLSQIWIAVGLTIGAYLNYLLLAPKFRVYTEVANDSMTIPDYLENRFKDASRVLRLVSGTLILVFFVLYVSSGIVAGGKLFISSFNLSYTLGVVITLSVVVLYTFFGGFIAVSLTDFFQGCLMFLTIIAVPVVAYMNIDMTPGTFVEQITAINPTLFNIFEGTTVIGIISLLAWGLGYFGQPHIIVRFMAIKSTSELKSARRIGIGWMAFGLLGAVASGMTGLVYLTQRGIKLEDPETVFLVLGDILFHPFITGIILAAVLAAIMSTISSQLLVCASSVTQDFYLTFFNKNISDRKKIIVSRFAVVGVALIATILAYLPNKSILNIVGQAWAGFGASFGPVILMSLYWRRMTKWGALSGMLAGGLTVILWISLRTLVITNNIPVSELTSTILSLYEMIPGFIASILATYVVSMCTAKPEGVNADFDKMDAILLEDSKK
ncbi:MAG: sodium/proline symporter PutP [Clostridium sp.]